MPEIFQKAERKARLLDVRQAKCITSPPSPTTDLPIMAPRASSPALSETEFDIFDALAGGDDVQQETGLDADLGIDLDVGHGDGSDDEASIAAKQAASNRKASNVGKSV